MRGLTNTQRLILSFEHAEKFGDLPLRFLVGRYTGNGPSVVAALRRRGYKVEVAGQATYAIIGKQEASGGE